MQGELEKGGGRERERTNHPPNPGLVDQSGTTVTPRKDFQALATAIKNTAADTANPSISMNSYTASNVPRACPAVTTGLWEAAEALPPTPNATLCENMVASSSCVPTEATTGDAEKIGSLFGTVCGMDAKACAGITSDAAKGVYGDFVMCNPVQQLTHALNEYYANQKKASTACDFAGQAKVVSPTEAAITPSSGSTSGSSSGSGSSSSSSGGSGSVSGTSASPSSPSTSANNSTAPASGSSSSGSSSQQGGSAGGGSSASQNGTASSSGAGGKSQGGGTTAEKGGSSSDSSATPSSAVSSSAAPASATASSSTADDSSSAGASDASSSSDTSSDAASSPDAASDASSDASADASAANPASVVSSSASESASQGSNSATVIQGSSDAGRTSVVGNTGLLLAAVAVIASTLL